MELYCAIDLRGGQAVRLHQGDFDKERSFGDPLELADRFVAAGAPRLHVVDLDAARTSEPINRAVIRRVVERVPVPVQVGGGVRTDDDVAVLLGMGADRVVMGTTALREPDVAHACAARFAGRIVLALDYRHRADGEREAAVAGWSEGSGVTVSALLDAWRDDPLAAVAVTSIERDGTGGARTSRVSATSSIGATTRWSRPAGSGRSRTSMRCARFAHPCEPGRSPG